MTTWRGGTCVRAHWSLRITGAGWLVLLIGVGVCLAAINTANSWLLLLGCAIVAPLVVSLLPSFGAIHVHATTEFPARSHVGDVVEHTIAFYNAGRRSLPAMRLHQTLPGLEDLVVGIQPFGPGRRGDAHARRLAVARAVSPRATFVLETTAPFGLTLRRLAFVQSTDVVVHPRAVPPVSLAALGAGEEPANRPGRAGGDLHALREWRRGDELRHVHWRATARHGRLVVVVPELTHAPRLAVVVAGLAADPGWEELVSSAAWTAVDAVRRGHTLRLLAGGGTPLEGPDAMHALDWFAGLGDVRPVPREVLDAAATWVGDQGVVLVASTRPVPAARAPGGRLRVLHPTGPAPR